MKRVLKRIASLRLGNSRRWRTLLGALMAIVAIGTVSAADPVLPADATDAEARKYLADIRFTLDREMTRLHAESRAAHPPTTNPVLMADALRLAKVAAASHPALVCDAVVQADSDPSLRLFASVLMGALTQRTDYAPAQKEIILSYLPKLPGLILVVDHMNWFEGAEAAITAGWKKERADEPVGMLTANSSAYATIAASHGVTDALVAIARTVRDPKASTRNKGRLLEVETVTLKALVPVENDSVAALADFVVKNKAKLVFDPSKAVYTLAQ